MVIRFDVKTVTCFSYPIELHKYQSTYDDSLTIKIYLFQFVNFYSSLFYVAFFKGRFESNDPHVALMRSD